MSFAWSKQRVLVTGATGFLGTNMVEALRKCDCFIDTSQHSSICDLTDGQNVDTVCTAFNPTAVVHMAGLVGGIGANLARPAEFFYENLLMGILLAQYAMRHGVKKFVAVGAGCGYPEHAPIPTKETDLWNGYPQAPSAPYSLAKRMLVVQAEAMYQQYGFRSVIGMPGNIYGPHDNFSLQAGHVIPALVRKFVEAVADGKAIVSVWGTGRATRDFVYVGDVCGGLLRIAEAYDTPELVNLSSGVETSIAEVVDLLVKLTAFKGRVVWDVSKPDGQLRRCFDVSKAAGIGWRAVVSLKEGLGRTVEWYRANKGVARR